MLLTATEGESAAWLSGLWVYYRDYTRTAIHAASAAALTAFGLLIFIDPPLRGAGNCRVCLPASHSL